MTDDHLAQARADLHADWETLADLTDQEVDDLAHVHELYDPVTDGVECDFKRRI